MTEALYKILSYLGQLILILFFLLVIGRTFVHHAVKRFMVILPAIFFKLGIAFTLLIIVSLVAVNNGVIGFLILVVGLSSVLARLQQTQTPHLHPLPLIAPPAPVSPAWAHHFIDRSDNNNNKGTVDYRPSYAKVNYGSVDSANNYVAQVQRLNDLLQMQQRNVQVYNGYAKN